MDKQLINELELFTPMSADEKLKYFGKLEIYHELFNNELNESSLSSSLKHITTDDELYIRVANQQLEPIKYHTIRAGADAVVDIDINDMEGYWVEISTDGLNYQRVTVYPDTDGVLVVAEWLEGLRFRILVTNYEGLIYHDEIYYPKYKPVIANIINTGVGQINCLVNLLSICAEYGYICNAYSAHEFGKRVHKAAKEVAKHTAESSHHQAILNSYIRVYETAKTARENNWEEVAEKLAKEVDTCIYYLILSAVERTTSKRERKRNRKLKYKERRTQH